MVGPKQVSNKIEQVSEIVHQEATVPDMRGEFPKNNDVAWGIPGVLEIKAPKIPISIPGQEKGPLTAQVKALEEILTKSGHHQGNTEPENLGKLKGNDYTIQRTEDGVKISVTAPQGTYTVEINGRNGKLTSATFVDPQGNPGGDPTEATIVKMIDNAIKLGVSQNAAPELEQTKPNSTNKAPDL